MTWSEPAFGTIARTVQSETGLNLAITGVAETETRIRRAMASARIVDVNRYATLLRPNSIPFDALVTEFTVGETYFFRNARHFDFIRSVVAPDILRRRGPGYPFRIWSAGCATGEEAYSVAIVLEEEGFAGHVMATDISRPALRQAREASYRRWSLRDLDDTFIARWFTPAGDRWQLDHRVQQRATFLFHNLAHSGATALTITVGNMDLILCRNVLIYLERSVVNEVAARFVEALSEGGWLITGPSDPPLNHVPGLVPVLTKHGVFYQKTSAQALPASSATDAEPKPTHVH